MSTHRTTALLLLVLFLASGCADGLLLDDETPRVEPYTQALNAATDNPADLRGVTQGIFAPVLTTFRSDDGAVGSLAFRSATGVAINSAPLLLDIEGRRFEAPLTAGPARFSDPDGTVVDQATYRLPIRAYFALQNTPTARISVHVHDGAQYIAYPYVSGDLIEEPAPVEVR